MLVDAAISAVIFACAILILTVAYRVVVATNPFDPDN